MAESKSLEYYRKQPYTVRSEMVLDDSSRPFWSAQVEEFEGCISTGKTEIEAVNNLHVVFDDYVSALLEWGDNIPEPRIRGSVNLPGSFVEQPNLEIDIRVLDSTDRETSGESTPVDELVLQPA